MLYYSVLSVLLNIELFFQHGHEQQKSIKRTTKGRCKDNYPLGVCSLALPKENQC